MANENRNQWALLIGIDHYPNFGPEWQLQGCGNDVEIMRAALVERFSFTNDQIILLRDEHATREGILQAMEDLIQRASKEDEVVFFYSGHGSSQTDGVEGDECDGFDETLVPHDSGRRTHPNRDITDDEIYLWLLRLTNVTPFVTLILDCCHTSTILRDSFGNKIRSVPTDNRPSSDLAACISPEFFDLLRGGEDAPMALRRLEGKYVAIAACGSAEVANEILIGRSFRIAHGALTYCLAETLMAPDYTGATWREVFEQVKLRVSAYFRTQHPEIEGARDRAVFGARDIRRITFLSIEAREGNTVTLGAGKASGLTVGSQWNVYAPVAHCAADDVEFIGTVEILSVGVTSSKAQIVEEGKPGEIRPGTRAVESARFVEGAGFIVEIVAPPGHPLANLFAERLKISRFLRKADAGELADARVYLASPRSSIQPTDPAAVLGPLSEETWVPIGLDGSLLAPALPCKHPHAAETLVERLENKALLRGLLGINNPNNNLDEQIDFFIYRLDEARCLVPAQEVEGEPAFFEGEHLVLEIRNRSGIRLYIYILDIGLTGKVTTVFPALGSHESLDSGQTIRLGVRDGEDLQVFFPEDFDPLFEGQEVPTEGRETLKLFASTSPANFHSFFVPAMRLPRRGAWGLDEVLNTAINGGYGYVRTRETWTTIERVFRLRRRATQRTPYLPSSQSATAALRSKSKPTRRSSIFPHPLE